MVILLAVLVGQRGRRHRRTEAKDRRARRAPAARRLATRFLSAARFRLDADDRAVHLPRASTGGRPGIPAPSRAAAATSPSASSPPRTNAHGVLATLWFNVAHYALRPWPWILTALASIVLYPESAKTRNRATFALHGPGGLSRVAPRLHDRRLRRRLHVDDRHAAQLGRVVRRQRFLPPLRRPRRQRAALRRRLASRHGAADGVSRSSSPIISTRSRAPGSC